VQAIIDAICKSSDANLPAPLKERTCLCSVLRDMFDRDNHRPSFVSESFHDQSSIADYTSATTDG
jgi:hypothetical protein